MSDPKTIETGTYLVEAPCPRCGVVEEILARLSTVLTTPQDDAGALRVKIKSKPRDHDCAQGRIADLRLEDGK